MSLSSLQSRLQTVQKVDFVKEASGGDNSLLSKVKSKVRENIKYLKTAKSMDDEIPTLNGNRKACSPLWFKDDNGNHVWTLQAGRTKIFLNKEDIISKDNFKAYDCGSKDSFVELLEGVLEDMKAMRNEDFQAYASIKKPVLKDGDFQYEKKEVTRDGQKKVVDQVVREKGYSVMLINDSTKY